MLKQPPKTQLIYSTTIVWIYTLKFISRLTKKPNYIQNYTKEEQRDY